MEMPLVTIQRVLEPAEEDRKAILEPLLAYNLAKAGDENYKPLALLLRDNENEVRGGLWAKLYYDWLFIEPAVRSGSHAWRKSRIKVTSRCGRLGKR